MPAGDIYHDTFVRALIKDGWTITHDPLSIPIDDTTLLIEILRSNWSLQTVTASVSQWKYNRSSAFLP